MFINKESVLGRFIDRGKEELISVVASLPSRVQCMNSSDKHLLFLEQRIRHLLPMPALPYQNSSLAKPSALDMTIGSPTSILLPVRGRRRLPDQLEFIFTLGSPYSLIAP